MNITVFNTKVNEVENKITNHDKYITTLEFNKLAAKNFTARLKQANLVTKTDFEKKLISLNRKITWNKTKYLEVQQKLNSLITNDYKFFLGRMYFTRNGEFQNTFVYQPTLDKLELKKDETTDYVHTWKPNAVYNSKLKPLYTAFLRIIKRSVYKMGIKFDKDPLAVEQSNDLTEIANVYIAYDLAGFPKILLRNFTLKSCFFGATNRVKNSDKDKWV